MADAFDPADPVNTPAMLNVLSPLVMTAFADGVQRLQDAGIPLDAAMGDIQVSGIHDKVIPVFGGEGFEGSFTIASSRGDGLSDGTYDVTYGNSYIQTVTWGDDGQPRAEGFVTYSQSTDPASPWFSDMTEEYSAKRWIRFPWAEADIAADPALINQPLVELVRK